MCTPYYSTKKLWILPKEPICLPYMILMWNISYHSSLFRQRGGLLSSKEKTAFYFSVFQFGIYSERLIYVMWDKPIAQDSKLKIMNAGYYFRYSSFVLCVFDIVAACLSYKYPVAKAQKPILL